MCIYIYNAKVSDLFYFDSDILYFSYLCRITLLEYEVLFLSLFIDNFPNSIFIWTFSVYKSIVL